MKRRLIDVGRLLLYFEKNNNTKI